MHYWLNLYSYAVRVWSLALGTEVTGALCHLYVSACVWRIDVTISTLRSFCHSLERLLSNFELNARCFADCSA